jgi:hypothetical protein
MTVAGRGRETILYWSVLVVAGAVSLVLGYEGFREYFAARSIEKSFFDLAYLDWQLFTLESGALSGPVPLELEIARILAPSVAAAAVVRLLGAFLLGRFRVLRQRMLEDHLIVCGLGKVGYNVATSAAESGLRVLVIEQDAASENLHKWKESGQLYLAGSATAPHMLARAGVMRARALVAACGEDGRNVSVALAARDLLESGSHPRRSVPLACDIQVVECEFARLLKSSPLFLRTDDQIDFDVFNVYDAAARRLSHEHPLDRVRIAQDSPLMAHLVVLGLGQMGMSVAVQYAKVAHFANGKFPRISVLDHEARRCAMRLRTRCSALDRVADMQFHDRELDDPDSMELVRRLVEEEHTLATIAVCLDDESQCLARALVLKSAIARDDVPVLVRMSSKTGLAALLREQERVSGLHAFGMREDVCRWSELRNEQLDRQAREVHRLYSARAAESGRPPGPEWSQLDPELQDSSRQQADHIPVKLRAIGCEIRPLAGGGTAVTEFEPGEIELLARMEHRRWAAERLMSGWKFGPKDVQRKLSPYLVDYDQVAEDIKEYDRDAIRNLPRLVEMAGGKIVRQTPDSRP